MVRSLAQVSVLIVRGNIADALDRQFRSATLAAHDLLFLLHFDQRLALSESVKNG
jgi:hypothetical protein